MRASKKEVWSTLQGRLKLAAVYTPSLPRHTSNLFCASNRDWRQFLLHTAAQHDMARYSTALRHSRRQCHTALQRSVSPNQRRQHGTRRGGQPNWHSWRSRNLWKYGRPTCDSCRSCSSFPLRPVTYQIQRCGTQECYLAKNCRRLENGRLVSSARVLFQHPIGRR